MIKVDLITGFLGSGKTTFIKKYAEYLINQGNRIGILENDFGAVNVDVMLLQELEGDKCGIETIAGACDADCHKRRFKTKLIALAMCGYDRVIIEPSGIFDIDEFFDVLHEEPLDRWYEAGSVISIVDAGLKDSLSEQSEYLLASQCANAGRIILSRVQETTLSDIDNTIENLNKVIHKFDCKRKFGEEILSKDWNNLDDNDFDKISKCGYKTESYVKVFDENNGYKSLYYMNTGMNPEEVKNTADKILRNSECGNVFRIKGFVKSESQWYEINAVKKNVGLKTIDNGQEIIIVIGEDLNKQLIDSYFEKK